MANPEWLVQAQRPAWLNREPRWGRGMDWLRLLGRWRQQDPFRLHRLEVELPEEAWAEAQGGEEGVIPRIRRARAQGPSSWSSAPRAP